MRLLIRKFPPSFTWFRVHRAVNPPLFFGRSGTSRFDAPANEFGVLYVGKDVHCAFIETFAHATGIRFVTETALRDRELSLVTTSRPLRLVDLRGEGLARMGADAALTSGTDYALAHRWAKAMHDHPRQPDGLVYRARHDPTRTSAALFDRASAALTTKPMGSLLQSAHERLLGDILETYGFSLVP
jgi:hypothetical protein